MACCDTTLDLWAVQKQRHVREGSNYLWYCTARKTNDCYLATPLERLQGFRERNPPNRIKHNINACDNTLQAAVLTLSTMHQSVPSYI